MEYKDYYKILEVDKNSSLEDIEEAYRKLARKHQPDVTAGNKQAQALLKELDEAHQVLTDPERRARYDQLSASWRKHLQAGSPQSFDWDRWQTGSPSAGQSGDFSEFFETIFREVKQSDAAVPQPGPDITKSVEITLEEAFSGATRILQMGNRKLEVRIPKGAKSGTKIRVRGEGGEGLAGGPKGDLYLEISVAPHPVFQQVGDDLHFDLPVDLYTAVLGGEAVVPLLKGKVKLKIPPETQSGRTFRLKGQGMPRLKHPDERGDLYARVMIQVPQNLSDEEIALFEELADLRGL